GDQGALEGLVLLAVRACSDHRPCCVSRGEDEILECSSAVHRSMVCPDSACCSAYRPTDSAEFFPARLHGDAEQRVAELGQETIHASRVTIGIRPTEIRDCSLSRMAPRR